MDRDINCQDCGNTFVFTESDQAFFQEKGFTDPKRCRACRDARKQGGGQGGGGGNRRQGGGGGGGNGGGGRQQDDREYFDAVCADCGAKTQVPFRPKADRPVFCRDCFKAKSPR